MVMDIEVEVALKALASRQRKLELATQDQARRAPIDPTNPVHALGRDLVDLGEVPMTILRTDSPSQTISSGAWETVALDTVEVDNVGGADLTNDLITARRTGLYL